MSLEQAILEIVRALPPEKQQEVLDHAERLRDEVASKSPFRSVEGLWADLGVSLSSEEIEENQWGMWQNCCVVAAKSVIREEGHSLLSERDSLRVLDLLKNPPKPNAKLRSAAKALPKRK